MPDSLKHSLVECNDSRCVWALAGDEVLDNIVERTKPNAKKWLFSLIDDCRGAQSELHTPFVDGGSLMTIETAYVLGQ